MKELAKNCSRSEEVRNYDKLSAAQHQLEGAIANLFLGNWLSAITLAGAAEGILPPVESTPDLYLVGKEIAISEHGMKERDFVSMFNEKMYWLKHNQKDKMSKSEVIGIGQPDAVVMIIRAYSRLTAHYRPLANNEYISEITMIFEHWFRNNYADWLDHSNLNSKA